MKKYVLLFRMDIITESAQPTVAQMRDYTNSWMKWIASIASNGQLAAGGHHFSTAGKVVKPSNVTIEGPYVADKESVAGYIIVLAKDMEDALSIARKCPFLGGEGTSVEIRETATPG
jgi:hypothetical protein